MHGWDALWLLFAGFGGGLCGSVAGLASIVSYPTLLAVGLPAVAANVTNSVALVFSSVGSVWGSRPELVGQGSRARRLCAVAVLGGVVGGVLLLLTPSEDFARLVPWLIGLASFAVLLPRRPVELPPVGAAPTRALLLTVVAIAIYGGYFGAAAGVMLLAALLHMTGEPLPRSNAAKNLVLGCANGVAALIYAVFGPVHWSDVAPLALGFLIGGRLGPEIVRRVPTTALRLVIAMGGIGLAVHLGLDAYR